MAIKFDIELKIPEQRKRLDWLTLSISGKSPMSTASDLADSRYVVKRLNVLETGNNFVMFYKCVPESYHLMVMEYPEQKRVVIRHMNGILGYN